MLYLFQNYKNKKVRFCKKKKNQIFKQLCDNLNLWHINLFGVNFVYSLRKNTLLKVAIQIIKVCAEI